MSSMLLASSTILGLARSELKLQTHNLLFCFVLVISGLFGIFIVQNLPSENGVLAWGSFYLTRTLITIGFIIPLIQAAFIVKATVRDVQHHMEELVFTTQISKFQYLLSRWLGVFIPSIAVYLVFLAGLFAGLIPISLSIEMPIDHTLLISSLTWASVLFVLPSMLLSSVVFFAIGLFSRSAFMVFLSAGLSFFVYQLLSIVTGSPTMAQPYILNDTLKLVFDLFDPMASAEFFQQVQHWTISDRNTRHVSLNDSLLLNRLLVLTTAALITVFSYRYYKLSLTVKTKAASKKLFKRKGTDQSTQAKSELTGTTTINTTNSLSLLKPITPQRNHYIPAFIALVKTEYMTTVSTKIFLFIAAAWSLILATEVLSGFTYTESLGVTSLATTTIAINRFVYDILPKFSAMFLVLFAAEIMWRDKEFNIGDLIDVTPISNTQRFLAKWSALVFIPFTFISLAIVISTLLQLAHGGEIEFSVYASLYVYVGFPLVCIATMVLFINAISANKITAIAISLVVVILSQSTLGQYIGFEHGLWQFGSSPQLMHSEMVGFSATSDAFWGYLALWSALSVLMALISFTLMSRGRSVLSIKQLAKINWRQTNNTSIALVSLFIVLTSVSAGHVYYQSNIVGNYQASNERLQWRADYERQYDQYKDLKQPSIIAVKTAIELYPSERRYALNATFTLQNKTNKAISSVLISTHRDVTYSNIVLDNAELVEYSPDFYQYLYKLNKPLKPQESIELTFQAERTHNGYNGITSDSFFTPDFIYFRDMRYMPYFGFSDHYTLHNNIARKEYDLALLPASLTLEQDIAKYNDDFSEQYKWATIETKISTSVDHVAVAPGELITRATVNNRNEFHYKTQQAIRKLQPIISGKLTLSKRDVDGTSLEVYHLKKHSDIAQEHLDSMADTLQYGNQHFDQYPAKQLRLFEMPNVLRMSGYAMPQMMLLDERLGFAVDRTNTDSFDHLYRRTAHETAHQWWGHGLDSAITEGGSMMVETLAVYTQAQLLNKKYGPEYMHRLLQYANDRYFFARGQSNEPEKPLYRASENHLIYSKGTVAMNALQNRLGENNVNEALRAVLKNHRYPNKPATSLDFIEALNTVTNFNHQSFINYWLKGTAVSDWNIEKAEVLALANGRFNVSVCVSDLFIDIAKSNEVVKPLSSSANIALDIGFFTDHPASFYDKPVDQRTLAQETLQIIDSNRTAKSQYCAEYVVSKKPKFVQVDPYYQTLDQRRDNNLIHFTQKDEINE